jgi:hypothetical protein
MNFVAHTGLFRSDQQPFVCHHLIDLYHSIVLTSQYDMVMYAEHSFFLVKFFYQV